MYKFRIRCYTQKLWKFNSSMLAMKSMTINEHYAGAMYEWWLALKQLKQSHDQCGHCTETAKKLEKCLGVNEVRRLKHLVKKYPYSIWKSPLVKTRGRRRGNRMSK